MWFTTSADNNAILIQTGPDTWKAKRIKQGSPALMRIGYRCAIEQLTAS